MPTKNVTGFVRTANRAAEERDLLFWVGVPTTLAAGGVVGAEAAEWVVRQVTGLGMGTTTGRTVIGFSKIFTGALFVGAADSTLGLSTYPGAIVALAGVGAAFAGGADLYGVVSNSTPLPDLLSPSRSSRGTSRRRLKRATNRSASRSNSGSSGAGSAGSQAQVQRSSNMSANRGTTPSAYS